MLKVLVTGATGFIGSQLVKDLAAANYEVVAFVRRTGNLDSLKRLDIKVRHGDITNLRSLIEACQGVDIVIHLAAITSSEGIDYEKSFQVNAVGSQNLIDACKINHVKRVIFMGTQSDNPGAYATTKREAEKLFLDSGLNVTAIKPSLVYGPGGRGLIPGIIQFIKRFPVIPIVGTGQYKMKPIYVGDVTQAIIKCIEKDNTESEYLISGITTLPYCQFMDEIVKVMGLKRMKVYVPYFLVFLGVALVSIPLKNFPITIDTLRGLVNPRVYESEAAEKDLGFAPLSLEEGLMRTFAQPQGGEGR